VNHSTAIVALVIASLAAGLPAVGQEIVYPPNSGIFNVVTDGGVDNTGKTDVTQKLQKILDDGTNATQRRLQVLYFPKGTYLVSGQLRMKLDRSRAETSHSHGPWLVGQSRTETVIRLKDGTWTKPLYDTTLAAAKIDSKIDEQCVLSTGDSTNTTFNKIIRNMTISTGRNNAGAIGVQYNTSNSGWLGDVDIISEDGAGQAGLALAGVENGPGQVRNVNIRGFAIGLLGLSDYVIACSDVSIKDATTAGVLNQGMIAGEDFRVEMKSDAPAIVNRKNGAVSMLGASLAGKGKAAVVNEGDLYIRDIKLTGFANSVGDMKAADVLSEYFTGKAVGLFYQGGTSLRLPIKKTPVVPYETDMTKWVSPMDFGAVGDGKADDTEAMQKALSAPGRTHVIVPFNKVFRVSKSLKLGPDVVRVVGTIGRLRSEIANQCVFEIGDGKAPAVVLEGLNGLPPLLVKTDRTVIIDSVGCGYFIPPNLSKVERGKYKMNFDRFEGGGDVFINNYADSFLVDNPRQNVWIRHYNSELGGNVLDSAGNPAVPVTVNAGTLWILGWKSENLTQRIRLKGGAIELTGFNNYSVSVNNKDGDWPIAEVLGGSLCINQLVQHGREPNANIVWETREGQTRKLTIKDNGGRNVPLYTGFQKASAASAPAK
jgi:hypothetical protein